MGRNVISYRMALEFEIERWNEFRKALLDEKARDAFDEGQAACNPELFEPMLMSILLCQPRRFW